MQLETYYLMFHIHVETCNLSGIILAFKFPRVRAWFNLSQEGFVFHFWNLLRQNELFPFNKMRRQVLFPSPIIYTLSRKFFKAKSNKMILINWKQKFWILIHSKRFFRNAQERRTNQWWPGWTHKQLYRTWWHDDVIHHISRSDWFLC